MKYDALIRYQSNLPGIGELIEDGLLQHGWQIIRMGSAQVSENLKAKQKYSLQVPLT
jgi:hypothetical protein